MLIEFMGATSRTEDDGSRTWEPRGPVVVNLDHIVAVYDHSVVVPGNIIRVMESYAEIIRVIERYEEIIKTDPGRRQQSFHREY